jgi:hypothetical protein
MGIRGQKPFDIFPAFANKSLVELAPDFDRPGGMLQVQGGLQGVSRRVSQGRGLNENEKTLIRRPKMDEQIR